VKFLENMFLSLSKHELILLKSGQINLKQLIIMLPKQLLTVQIPGHKKIKQAPQLFQSVLDGGAREDKAMTGLQTLYGFEFVGFYVFYYVALVQDYEFEVQGAERLDLLLYYGVVCY
jgi:hypothetical protein